MCVCVVLSHHVGTNVTEATGDEFTHLKGLWALNRHVRRQSSAHWKSSGNVSHFHHSESDLGFGSTHLPTMPHFQGFQQPGEQPVGCAYQRWPWEVAKLGPATPMNRHPDPSILAHSAEPHRLRWEGSHAPLLPAPDPEQPPSTPVAPAYSEP